MKYHLLLAAICFLFASCKNTDNIAKDSLTTGESSPYVIPGDDIENVISVHQNWSKQTQELFWFTGQGSKMLPYEWFIYLEQKNSTTLFSDETNILKYGFIPQTKSKYNPDSLPIGFAASSYEKDGKWLFWKDQGSTQYEVHYDDNEIVNTLKWVRSEVVLED